MDARGYERRVVNLAADLREPGSELVDVEVADLAQEGYMMRCALALEPGAVVWLKLPGFAAMKSEVIWAEDGKAGCRFATPLYRSIIELIIAAQPKSDSERLFTHPAMSPQATHRAA